MTRASLRERTFRRLQESATSPVFWTVADVDAALDAAYVEISDETAWCERSFTVDLLKDRPAYDLRTLTPDDVLTVGPAFNYQTNRWLTPVRPMDLDIHDRRWEQVLGEPSAVIARGLWWVTYYPRSGSDGGTIEQYVSVRPEPMTADTDEPGFPEAFHLGLVEHAVSDLFGQDHESALAVAAWQAYEAYEAGLSAFIQGRSRVPLRHGHA